MRACSTRTATRSLLASTNPAAVAYDPAFGFEIGHIVRDGLRRMYGDDPENVFYYLTLYNEAYVQPAEPEDVDVDGILARDAPVAPRRGSRRRRTSRAAAGVRRRPCRGRSAPRSCCVTTGASRADVWSVTSWNELRRDGLDVESWNFLHPGERAAGGVRHPPAGRSPWPGRCRLRLDARRAGPDPGVGARRVQRRWAPTASGMSDTRGALRRHFKVDAESITLRTLEMLARRGEVDADAPRQAFERYQLGDVRAADPGQGMGDA